MLEQQKKNSFPNTHIFSKTSFNINKNLHRFNKTYKGTLNGNT